MAINVWTVTPKRGGPNSPEPGAVKSYENPNGSRINYFTNNVPHTNKKTSAHSFFFNTVEFIIKF